MPKITTILLLFVCLLSACSSENSRQIVRLDRVVSNKNAYFADDIQSAFESWTDIIGFEGDVNEYAVSPVVNAFQPLVDADIVSLDSVENVIGQALADYPALTFYAVVSPYSQSVVTDSENRVFIALNHYLGSNSKAYAGFPEYLRRRKEFARLPIDVVEAVVASKVAESFNDDAQLVNYLLYRGALLCETSRLLPSETSDALLLAMTDDELNWCKANELRIWQTLIEQNLLYSSDLTVIERLLKPSPKSTLINANAPGQTALYIALQLARSYNKNNPDAPLLQNGRFNDNQSLIKSNYFPTNADR